MTDSYQSIITDCETVRDSMTGVIGTERIVMGLTAIIDRLEALQAQPVAWMKEEGGFVQRQESAILSYTIPLIRAD